MLWGVLAMKTVKLNFTIAEDIAEALRARVGARRRSSFVAGAIRDKLNRLEQDELRRTLVEGYLARREEDVAVNEEWENPTLEGWG